MGRVQYSPDRLKKPLLREGERGSGKFKESSWSAALDYVAENLIKIREKYGNASIIRLGGSGACNGALHNTSSLTKRFLSCLGGFTETYSNYSSAAAQYTTPYIFGTNEVGIDPNTLEYTNLIILWGANIVDNRLGVPFESKIRKAKSRGVKVIVIDPRRTTTVKSLADKWVPIYPGTDVSLMMAVLFILLKEDLVDRKFIKKYSYGFEDLENFLYGDIDGIQKSPEWAEKICGTPSEIIIDLALVYGRTHPTALIPGLSIQRTIGGEEAIRMSITLQTATGNIGVLGGSTGALTWGTLPSPKIGSISIPLNHTGISIPVYRWADAILEGKKGGFPSEIKAIYNVGGNFIVQGSDVKKNIKAFQKVEFSVCHEHFLTTTANYCDVVFPTTTFLERDDFLIPDGGNYLLLSKQAINPIHEVKNDYEIFREISKRIGFEKEFSEGKNEEDWLSEFLEYSEIIDRKEFLNTGVYWGKNQYRVGLSDFIKDPLNNPLQTPSGKIEIKSENYARTGFSAIPSLRIMEINQKYPLRLITPKSRYRVNSQNYNIKWFRERENQGLWINIYDAETRKIKDGDKICIKSVQGIIHTNAIVTEEIMKGVVCLLEGVWPSLNSEGIDLAGSANILTSTEPTLPSHGSRTHSTLVQVKKI
ncbi:molybdopterin-dependent oxidoreductase [Candidatus Bathyarchaeota archaeon]|nr:molybdopterin-dependent oxidoreductase [Candidatus Bathyarchaeota archaeon]